MLIYGKRILGSFGKFQVAKLTIASQIIKKGAIIHINMFSVRSFIEVKSILCNLEWIWSLIKGLVGLLSNLNLVLSLLHRLLS